VLAVVWLYTTNDQKESMLDAAKQACDSNTARVMISDAFIVSVDDRDTKEQLRKLQSLGTVSLNVAENIELLDDLYRKGKINLDLRCRIIEAAP